MKMVYCTANEKRTFSYVEVPKVMFTEPALKSISSHAKLLYGLLLDRKHLSEKNGWVDADGRVYIYFTLDDAMEALGCSKNKALKTFDELDEGVGLIRREKQEMLRNTTKVRNIKSYLLTALYNVPSTISSYYRAEANYDLAKVAG